MRVLPWLMILGLLGCSRDQGTPEPIPPIAPAELTTPGPTRAEASEEELDGGDDEPLEDQGGFGAPPAGFDQSALVEGVSDEPPPQEAPTEEAAAQEQAEEAEADTAKSKAAEPETKTKGKPKAGEAKAKAKAEPKSKSKSKVPEEAPAKKAPAKKSESK